MHGVLAGSPGAQPSATTVVVVVVALVLLVGGGFGIAALAGGRWHQGRAAGARQEASTEPVLFTWPVQVRRAGYFAFHGPGLQGGYVRLRGRYIEVAHGSPVARTLNRGEFYFPAAEARIWVDRAVLGRQWIVINGPSGGQRSLVSVSPGSRQVLEEIWNALIAAGARQASI